MSQKRSPRHTTASFASALAAAASERGRGVPHELREHPDPFCLDAPDVYVDFDLIPDQDTAFEMCADCPLMVECAASARRTKPAWGVWGGIAWLHGRQAHLLNDERMLELMAEAA